MLFSVSRSLKDGSSVHYAEIYSGRCRVGNLGRNGHPLYQAGEPASDLQGSPPKIMRSRESTRAVRPRRNSSLRASGECLINHRTLTFVASCPLTLGSRPYWL